MRETLVWHLKKLSEFYAMKLNCPNCKYSGSLGYWINDKKEIDDLISKMEKEKIIVLLPEGLEVFRV